MLYVNADGTIQLTRGDTARLSVTIENELTNGNYEVSNSDKLCLTVKRKLDDAEPVFQKMIIGANQFHILPKDTQGLDFGKYLYDVELTTAAGDVYTVIVPSTFEILKEITF